MRRLALGLALALALPATVWAGVYGPPTLYPSYSWPSLYPAKAYGTCIWDGATSHDVGPCVNAAIAAVAAAGGGAVVVPAGAFYYATAIVQNTSGVHLLGAGAGIPRDTISPNNFLAATRLIWNGAAGQSPAAFVGPAGNVGEALYSADVVGIVFDGNSTADVSIEMNVANSTINLGCAEARKTCFWGTTQSGGNAAPGFADNDIWIWARNVSASFSATGILFDGGGGWSVANSGNVHHNRMHQLFAAFASGDGIVFGFSDTNQIYSAHAYHYAGSGAVTGSPIVFANENYTPPSGVAVTGHTDNNHIAFTGAAVRFVGSKTGSTWTVGGGNTGSGALNPTTISTNATTTGGSSILNFASTAGVSVNESVNCGGAASGAYPNALIRALTATTVTMSNPMVLTGGVTSVASGQSCTFSYAVSNLAVAGSYTITATGAGGPFNITAPGAGHSETGVAVASGALSFKDVYLPWTGTAQTNDTWTLVVPAAATRNDVALIDKDNAVSDPYFEPAATGSFTSINNPLPIVAGAAGVVMQSLGFGGSSAGCCTQPSTASGLGALVLGGSNNAASANLAAIIGADKNNTASAFGATIFGGATNTASGIYGSIVGSQQATDRGRYNSLTAASGNFAVQGDAQFSRHILRGAGASASAIRLTADNGAAGASNCVNIPNNSGFQVHIRVMAFDHTTVTKNEEWGDWNGLLTRGANAASTTLLMDTTPTPKSNGTVTGSTIAATADTTNGCLNISFTPPTSNTETWNAVSVVEAVEVQ